MATVAKNKKKLAEIKKLTEATKFLSRFGIDTDELEDEEILEKYDKVMTAKDSRTKLQVLSRGRTLDGIDAILALIPKGFVGELKRERDIDIQLAQAQGWKVFFSEQKVENETPHGVADRRIRFGDLILMYMPEEEYIALQLSREDARKDRRDYRKIAAGAKVDPGDGSFPIENL
jgi:hypothetical protein